CVPGAWSGAILTHLISLHSVLLAISPSILMVITAAVGAQARGLETRVTAATRQAVFARPSGYRGRWRPWNDVRETGGSRRGNSRSCRAEPKPHNVRSEEINRTTPRDLSDI